MYYIYSFFIAIIIFIILQYIINKKDEEDKNKEKDKNIEKVFTFIIIYGIITLLCYFINENIDISSLNINTEEIQNTPLTNNVDVNLLRKIPEEVDTGFKINDSDPDPDSDSDSDT